MSTKSYPNATYSISEFYHFDAWGGRAQAMAARGRRKKQLASLGWTDIRISTGHSSDLGGYCYVSALRPKAAAIPFQMGGHTSDGSDVARVSPGYIPSLPETPWHPDFSHCELHLYTHNKERGPYITLNVDSTRKHFHDRGHGGPANSRSYISWGDWKRGVRTAESYSNTGEAPVIDFTIALREQAAA